MLKSIKDYVLPGTVFLTGACVLVIEVVATRILSPYYGNTIYTVSSVISVILAALSLGYYLGGRLADKHPSLTYFYGIIMLSGIGVLLFHSLGAVMLPFLSDVLPITSGSLVSALVLFFMPALLLGTLSPYAVKLQSIHAPKQGVGSAAGTMFFWSTMGSIVGSLSAGFLLIPQFGVDQIVIGTGVVLFVLGFGALSLIGIRTKRTMQAIVAFVLVLGVALTFTHADDSKNIVYSKDGLYEKITIKDETFGGRPVRSFLQDRSSSGAMYLDTDDPKDLVYEYTKYYSLYKLFNPDLKDALIIGGGAYSIPKALLADNKDVRVDVSEIEPSLHDLSRTYFKLQDDPRLQTFSDDGRRFLRDTPKRYGMIFSDVYYSYYSIPAHFTTKEFFETAKSKLTENGIFVANMIGDLSRQTPSLTLSELRTFQAVFPNSYVFATESPAKHGPQNIILVGSNGIRAIDMGPLLTDRYKDPLFATLPARHVDTQRFELSGYDTLTDNFAPVDQLTTRLLKASQRKEHYPDGHEALAVIDQQLRYGPRYMGAPGRTKLQGFLQAEMQALAPKTEIQKWQHTSRDGQVQEQTNIVARFFPEQPRRIILGTHYDTKKHADRDKTKPNEPVPGANDGASGTAVLVEVARTLSRTMASSNVGVDIVFFDGEEGDPDQGSGYDRWRPLGSTYFASHLSDMYPTAKPESAVILDMVCAKNAKLQKEQSSLQAASKQVDTFWSIGKSNSSKLFDDTAQRTIHDDHTPLNTAGIPSLLVIGFDYPPFHTTKDTADKCSAATLGAVAKTTVDYIRQSQ